MLFVFRLWFWKLDASMHEPFNGFRGPLTPSQLIELQHQALIYKYITSIVAVPSNLIIPLKKSLCPYGFTSSSAASFSPNSCKFLANPLLGLEIQRWCRCLPLCRHR
ncbi:hypothetical protein V6N11_033613 [Hibiscus sabdariffa]|uniref:Growth-regulating factor n=1 Tax=Hibiscus sabdariffa TaxID=183260 RepID=A0ABR2PYI5_9ROSI